MQKVAIITDETCDMPLNFFEELAIEVMPFKIIFSDKVFNSVGVGGELILDEYYHRAEQELPTTSIPPPGVIAKTLERALAKAETVICLFITECFTSIYKHTLMVIKQLFPDKDIVCYDTKVTGAALATIVLETAKLVKAGKSKAEVIAKIEEWLPQLQYVGIMHTLENLVRTGRVKKTKKVLCDFLKIKPLIHFEDGNIAVVGKIRAADELMIKRMQRFGAQALRNLHPDCKTVIISHNRWPEAAEQIADFIQKYHRENNIEVVIQETNPIVANYTGKKLLSLGYIGAFENKWLVDNAKS